MFKSNSNLFYIIPLSLILCVINVSAFNEWNCDKNICTLTKIPINTTGGTGGNTTINNYYGNGTGIKNISGVTNDTQFLEFNLYPENSFPGWLHDETSGVHTLGIGLVPTYGDPGLLSSADWYSFNNKVGSQWTSFGTTFPKGIYFQTAGIDQIFIGDSFDVTNTTQLSNFATGISAPVVIYYDAFGARKKPHVNAGYLGYVYPLSIQKAGTDAYLEITNWNGENQGVFFGNYDREFELWNYAGGNIKFYTSTIPSDGTERVRITSNGSIVTGGIGASDQYNTWNSWDLISQKAKITYELNASIINVSTLCIKGDCRTSWMTPDNTSWNQSYADSLYTPKNEPLWTANQSLYYLKSNPLSFYNSSTFIWTEPLWTANQSSYYLKTNPQGFLNKSLITTTQCSALSCIVAGVGAGARVTVWAKGDTVAIGAPNIRLTRNGTTLDMAVPQGGTTTQKFPFSLIDYNNSASAGTWNYSFTTTNASNTIGNIKLIIRVET